MAITKTHQAVLLYGHFMIYLLNTYFFDRDHWENVEKNLIIFFQTYICPALLGKRPVTYCAKCDKVLLEESKISLSEQKELNSIQCDICNAGFHYKCENIMLNNVLGEIIEWFCTSCLVATAT